MEIQEFITLLKTTDAADLVTRFQLSSELFVIHCVSKGRLDCLDMLWAYPNAPAFFQSHEFDLLEAAVINDQICVLQWFAAKPELEIDLTAEQNWLFQSAISNSHTSVADWLLHDSGQPVDPTDADQLAVQYALFSGDAEQLQWVLNIAEKHLQKNVKKPVVPPLAVCQPEDLHSFLQLLEESFESCTEKQATIQWLCKSSGWLLDCLAVDTSWVLVASLELRREIVSYVHGIDPVGRSDEEIENILLDLPIPESMQCLHALLDAQGVSRAFSSRAKYCSSPFCQKAAGSRLFLSTAQLEQLLKKEAAQLQFSKRV